MTAEAAPVTPREVIRPQRTTIRGSRVRLEPLDAVVHGPALAEVLTGAERDELWRYLSEGPFSDRQAFLESMRAKSASPDPLFFAVVDQSRGAAMGYAALMRIDPVHRTIEVGHIVFSPGLQNTAAATEVVYLFARHVFDELGYRRFEWKCDARNEASQRAARRLGFTYEGTFRQHMIIKGRNRDTAWFAMLDGEWPALRARFERWLDPGNFDEQGRQKRRLEEA